MRKAILALAILVVPLAVAPWSVTFDAVKDGVGWRVTSVDGLPLDEIVGG